jgi:hypothetical protein
MLFALMSEELVADGADLAAVMQANDAGSVGRRRAILPAPGPPARHFRFTSRNGCGV